MLNAVELTRALIRFNTINPPGNEQPCAEYLGRLLEAAGFAIAYYPMGENRANLIARIGGNSEKPPLCFSGHTDVVPLGAKPWSAGPFAAGMADGKLYGRGSTDMKSGVAAFVLAASALAPKLRHTPGLVLIITAGEERGCEGANFLVRLDGVLGKAGAMVVAEPTANRPFAGHKGVMWLEAEAQGVTAHGSMPEKGVNAVYKAARAVAALENFDFGVAPHPVLGKPTLNVGWFRGGINVNSVPDEAKFGIDIRLTPGQDQSRVLSALQEAAGGQVTFTQLGASEAVWTGPADMWVSEVAAVMAGVTGEASVIGGAPYFTDAAALKPALGHPPTVILGPGEPEMAHQTDEFCYVRRIEEAVEGFTEIARRWCGL